MVGLGLGLAFLFFGSCDFGCQFAGDRFPEKTTLK